MPDPQHAPGEVSEAEVRAAARELCVVQGIDPDAQKAPGVGGWIKFVGISMYVGPYGWQTRRADAQRILQAAARARARAAQEPETNGG